MAARAVDAWDTSPVNGRFQLAQVIMSAQAADAWDNVDLVHANVIMRDQAIDAWDSLGRRLSG